MHSEALLCPFCYRFFNKDERIPLILPTCGHTYCSACIQSALSKLKPGESLLCPDDKTPYPLKTTDISQFPKNLMVLRFVEQREASSPLRQTKDLIASQQARREGNLSERSFLPTPEPGPAIKEITSARNLSHVRKTLSQHTSFFQQVVVTDNQNMCKEHGKKLDFVCLDHKCRICANCALVGGHKNHDIKTEEEAFREIAGKADRIIEVVQGLENTDTIMSPEQFKEIFDWKVKEKFSELEEEINAKFQHYIALVESKRDSVLEEARYKLDLLEGQLKEINDYPDALKANINRWKQTSQSLLFSICDKVDKGEIIFELLENKSSTKPDLIKEGEELVREVNRYTAIPLETIEKELNKLCPVFNENFSKQVDSLCSFGPQDIPSFTDLNNTKPAEPEFPASSGAERIETLNNRIRMSIERKFTSDNNLLNLEWKDFNATDNMALSGRKSNFGNFTSTYESNYGYEPKPFNQSVLSNINEVPEANYKDSFLSTTSDFSSRNPFKLDMGKIMHREIPGMLSNRTPRDTVSTNTTTTVGRMSVSPGGRVVNKGEMKSNKHKKKIKVPRKYESLIEGLEANKIEVADLFDAELGDQGVAILVEYLKGNNTLKTLKLVKNKITDEGAIVLVNALYRNNTLENLHLSQNLLTDKVVDYFLELFKFKTGLKTLLLSRNSINLRNVKGKVKEITDLGISISI